MSTVHIIVNSRTDLNDGTSEICSLRRKIVQSTYPTTNTKNNPQTGSYDIFENLLKSVQNFLLAFLFVCKKAGLDLMIFKVLPRLQFYDCNIFY